jgi:hypothetical protein
MKISKEYIFDKNTIYKCIKYIYIDSNRSPCCAQFMTLYSIIYHINFSHEQCTIFRTNTELFIKNECENSYDQLLKLYESYKNTNIKYFWFVWKSYIDLFKAKTSILCFICNTLLKRNSETVTCTDIRIYRNKLLQKIINLAIYPITSTLPSELGHKIALLLDE